MCSSCHCRVLFTFFTYNPGQVINCYVRTLVFMFFLLIQTCILVSLGIMTFTLFELLFFLLDCFCCYKNMVTFSNQFWESWMTLQPIFLAIKSFFVNCTLQPFIVAKLTNWNKWFKIFKHMQLLHWYGLGLDFWFRFLSSSDVMTDSTGN